jgi:hypothetical protein
MGGSTVGANTPRIEVLDSTSVPSPDEWQRIEAGKLDFVIRGTLEYCDSWGKYTCEVFVITYRPAAGNNFTIDTNSTCVSGNLLSSDPPSLLPPDLQLAPRCQQPEERIEDEKELEEMTIDRRIRGELPQ